MKLPLLFVLTNIICFPTLFIFSSFFGSKRTLLQTLILIQAGTSMMGIVLTGLAPVTIFFMVTTDHYQFFKIMNVVFFAVAGITGIVFFNRFLASSEAGGDSQSSSRRYFSRFWFLLYAFVGTQLAWTLRPFFGNPDLSFTLFRGMGGNFYTDIVKSIGHIFGAN